MLVFYLGLCILTVFLEFKQNLIIYVLVPPPGFLFWPFFHVLHQFILIIPQREAAKNCLSDLVT